MSITAYEGPAGCGKTTRLMESISYELTHGRFSSNQRLLALTFMHGSRRRLEQKLRRVEGMKKRYVCSTFDSFARLLVHRWRLLARTMGLLDQCDSEEPDFDKTCGIAGRLLEKDAVCGWVARAFPVVIVDEAQDLSAERVDIVRGLSRMCCLYLAADEYQCLNDQQANVAMNWLHETSCVTSLTGNYRTTVPALLNAALAVRTGQEVVSEGNFRVIGVPAFGLGAWEVASDLARGDRWNWAILSPVRKGFALHVVERLKQRPIGKVPLGPFSISWEANDKEEIQEIMDQLRLPAEMHVCEAQAISERHPKNWVFKRVTNRLKREADLTGKSVYTKSRIHHEIAKVINLSRRHSEFQNARIVAMTIHQAKNREFDGVILLWPYEATGSSSYQRRLLYNAITRARYYCSVIVPERSVGLRTRRLPFSAEIARAVSSTS